MFGFGKKKDEGRTVLVLDVENGSVACALLRLTPGAQPKLFGERRVHLPLAMSRTGGGLAASVEKALEQALYEIAEVAGRLRNAAAGQAHKEELSAIGHVSQASIIMSPPWGKPNLESGRPDFLEDMTDSVSGAVGRSFGAVPVSFYTSAGAAAYGVRALFGTQPSLVCVVTGEMTELLGLDEAGVVAHATMPHGSHALLRTLRSHGGYSEAEARSAARLPFDSKHLREPFGAAAEHAAHHFRDAARECVAPGQYSRIRVVGGDAAAEWFARALSATDSLSELFPKGEVRALRSQHVSPFVAAHAAAPDTMLLLNALFIGGQSSL
ncbi:hypothetical protein EXS62_02340 [Candidatus Kaiserbacteria bacterium]|nr:hypothetical protein [Candidatus Kaiserbacteria bacterium]